MKLEKYEDKRKKNRKAILISLGVIVLISISLLLYKTFATFTESAEFQVMKGQVDYFGNSDVYFAFYKGNDEKLEEMPTKDNKENLVFSYGECDNGASIEWDSEEWAPIILNLSKSKTKCSLYFNKATNAVEYITELAKTDTTNLMADDTSEANIRYVGATVNNYIDIGDKDSDGNPILWRIIGVMNNITNLDNGGQQESLVKIIRAESIGKYSWDSSAEGINIGRGVNEWSDADVMKILNPNTVYSGTPALGGSLYWNRESGSCYNYEKESNTTCDFTSSGISETAKEKIAKVRWNTGTFATHDNAQWIAKATYEAERGSHNGKEECESNGGGQLCNDTVSRKTTWDGYVGLMYPSDFGYAVGGSVRETCLGKSMNSYNGDSCYSNDWLKQSSHTWTMTPLPTSNSAYNAFYVNSVGVVLGSYLLYADEVMPAVYLKSTIKILENIHPDKEYGSQENPYIVR